MTICARPNAVSLAASHFEGPGLTQCIAGERAEFIIQVHREQDPRQTLLLASTPVPHSVPN